MTAATVAMSRKPLFAAETLDTSPRIRISLPEAHRGTPEIDMNLLNSYAEQPENVQAFFAKARAMFGADPHARFSADGTLATAAEKHDIPCLGGPMLGDVAHDRASLWLRTVRPAQVAVKVRSLTGSKVFGPVASTEESDLSVVIPLTGLEPSTRYQYEVAIDGKPLEIGSSASFVTMPVPGRGDTCRIAFGGDFHKVGVHNPHLMKQIVARSPRAMLLTGDLAVDDRNNLTGLHRSDYLLRDLSPAWQTLARTTPIYATWDDHDYFDNDKCGIPRGHTIEDVLAVRKIWDQNWVNPPTDEDREGIYFRTRLGPADLIMLDTRSLRKPERNSSNAYLGDTQMAWLKQELLKCKGPFTIISSGTMWSDYISNGKDSWGVYDTAGREELFTFIEENKIPGVLLICCDRHGSRGFRIPRPSGYNFHEFEIGTLGGMTGPGASGKDSSTQLFGRTAIKAFGEFEFDTTRDDPQVTFRLIDEKGTVLEQIKLSQSELTPG